MRSLLVAILISIIASPLVQPQALAGEPSSSWPSGLKFGALLSEKTESEKRGLTVMNVQPNGVAERAGIMKGDVIVSVASSKVESTQDFVAQLSKAKPGTEFPVEILRKDKAITLMAKF